MTASRRAAPFCTKAPRLPTGVLNSGRGAGRPPSPGRGRVERSRAEQDAETKGGKPEWGQLGKFKRASGDRASALLKK